MRRSASEKLEIIRLVENSDLGVKPFINSAILLISLFSSMIICVWNTLLVY
jgi:hypothetical protein